MNKLLLSTCLFLTIGENAFSQNQEDVLRYSYMPLNGSARVLGLGGTSVSAGADITSAFSNPAGLGLFRKSQYSLGLGLNISRTVSQYIDNSGRDSKTNLNIPSMGLAYTRFNLDKGKERKTGLIHYSMSFALNRSNSFNRRFSMKGENFSSSMADFFAALSNGNDPEQLKLDFNSIPGQAWNSYLINEDPQQPYSYYANLPDSVLMHQSGVISSSGRMNEFNFGMGFNYSNRLYFGFSLSLASLRYESTTTWTEQTGSFYATPRSFEYESGFIASGYSGLARLGAIFRFNDYVRAGVSYQSKGGYRINDNYYNNMSSKEFSGPGTSQSFQSDLLYLNYHVHTPSRISGAVSLFLPKKAMLNLEVESVDYSQGKLSSLLYNYSIPNANVHDIYQPAINFKSGLEILNGSWSYRVGYALFGSPTKEKYNAGMNMARSNFTAGLGYKNRFGFFVDMAIVYTRFEDFYTPYVLENSTRTSYTAVNNSQQYLVNFSIGSSF